VRALKPGDIVIDCGANIGDVARSLAVTGATVHAFEPDPLAFEELRGLTGCYPTLNVYQQAVSDREGTVRLFRGRAFLSDPLNQTVSSSVVGEKSNIDEANSIQVTQVDLLDFIRSNGRLIKLLKLDVEGSEVPILEALFESPVIEMVERIFVEMHDRSCSHFASRYASIRKVVAERFSHKINLVWFAINSLNHFRAF